VLTPLSSSNQTGTDTINVRDFYGRPIQDDTFLRELHGMSKLSAFLDAIRQDPLLSRVNLVAEPWDVAEVRLSGRQFPCALGGAEGQIPRFCSQLLEG
jgi:hypothetical protein